jgi:hypothetical protein
MKVRTFTGTHREAVDKQINDWLAQSYVKVRKTSTAFKTLRDKGWDAVTASLEGPTFRSTIFQNTRARTVASGHWD